MLFVNINILFTHFLPADFSSLAPAILQLHSLNKLTVINKVCFCIISLVICLSVSLCYKFVCLFVDQMTLFSGLIFALLN